jgi:hypothetical protein
METESEALLARIRGEFREMPGLRLTPVQARRLWGLDAEQCQTLMDALVEVNFLKRMPDGSFRAVAAR